MTDDREPKSKDDGSIAGMPRPPDGVIYVVSVPWGAFWCVDYQHAYEHATGESVDSATGDALDGIEAEEMISAVYV